MTRPELIEELRGWADKLETITLKTQTNRYAKRIRALLCEPLDFGFTAKEKAEVILQRENMIDNIEMKNTLFAHMERYGIKEAAKTFESYDKSFDYHNFNPELGQYEPVNGLALQIKVDNLLVMLEDSENIA